MTIAANKNRTVILTVCSLLPILALGGCYQPAEYPQVIATPQMPTTPPPTILAQPRIVGTSVQNRPIMCTVLGQGPDVTLILAAIHGNEPAGTPLVRRLAEYIRQSPYLLAGRTVVLLPAANPDGLAYNSHSNANGVDLNRNFSTANRANNAEFGRTALSEPEARAIQQLIRQYSPDRIVSIHQPLGCIDYDGPAFGIASRMGQYCSLSVKKVGAKPGSLGSYAGLTLGTPIITFEMLPGDSSLSAEGLWQKYGRALLAAVVYPDRVQ
jgi:protein MpaA